MSLSNEDSLRLNVLLVNAVATRIDEGALKVHGLLKDGSETQMLLNPNCHVDQYVKQVRELFSSTVLGSPGGYPVFLKRWTRMGQTSDARLDELLMLGEPEAVVAVTCARGLTDEIAEKAWWAMPDAANARRMLKNMQVVQGKMGPILAEFLVEFLPFEENPQAIIESVSLVLQGDITDKETQYKLWKKGTQKNIFRLGFLKTLADDLPDKTCVRSDRKQYLSEQSELQQLAQAGNRFACMLKKLYCEQGQSYLAGCEFVIKKPATQEAVVCLLDTLTHYFQSIQVLDHCYSDMDSLISDVQQYLASHQDQELNKLLEAIPEIEQDIQSMLVLAHAGIPVINPIFAITDAIGSLMRKKIAPVAVPVNHCLKTLQGSL